MFRPFRRHIVGKIILPHVIVLMILGALAIYTILDLAASSLGSELRDELVRRMVTLLTGAAAATLALGLYVARRITSPLKTLTEATELVRRNQLDFQLPVQTEDETGVLTVAFNAMAENLRERERSHLALEKYMSPKVYRLIQSGKLAMGGENVEIGKIRPLQKHSVILHTIKNDTDIIFIYMTTQNESIWANGSND